MILVTVTAIVVTMSLALARAALGPTVFDRIVWRADAAGNHDLDLGRALAQLVARGPAHFARSATGGARHRVGTLPQTVPIVSTMAKEPSGQSPALPSFRRIAVITSGLLSSGLEI